jgi:hypothetical protein
VNDVVELEEWRAAHGSPTREEHAEWRRFIGVVARDVVEHLPDIVPWKQLPEAIGVPASHLWAAALSGGLAVTRIGGTLSLLVRECEPVLIELLSVRLAVPRPHALIPAN